MILFLLQYFDRILFVYALCLTKCEIIVATHSGDVCAYSNVHRFDHLFIYIAIWKKKLVAFVNKNEFWVSERARIYAIPQSRAE